MKRFAALIAVGFVLVASPALAQPTADDVASQVSTSGFFIDEGLPATSANISESVNRARNAGIRLFVVLLDANPAGGATTFADAVYDRVGGNGTVVVLSGGGEGISSSEFEQPALEAALDHAFGNSSNDEGYVSALVDYFIDPEEATSSSDGGGGMVIILVLVAIVGLIIWGVRRSSRTATKRRASLLDEGRSELQEQISAVANKLLEISDLVSASETKKDDEYLRRAAATFTEVEESHKVVTDLHDLELLSDRLDEARWELEAAEAIAYDREVPPKPKPTERPVCFFDPTHTDASETAEIQTATGNRTVRVCKADADLLRRGRTPEPRMVTVGGESVPAPSAPKSHGGSGFDGLDLFTILTSGAATGASYNWGAQRTRAARNTWSSGSDRSSGSGSRSSSVSRASSRSSSSTPASRAGRKRKRGR